jgi:hypothetical protein
MRLHGLTATRLALVTQGTRELALAPGMELVGRVVSLRGGEGGRGRLALAGMLLEARLPHGVAAGEQLRLAVEQAGAGRLTLRVLHDAKEAAPAALEARLVGLLGTSGDGELLRAAMGLAGSAPLPLPDGGAVELAVDPDAEADGGSADGGEAAFVVHSPRLGPIEVRLRLAGGAVSAAVTVGAGQPLALAQAALPQLGEAIARASGRAAAATVAARRPDERVPAPPPELRRFSAYG